MEGPQIGFRHDEVNPVLGDRAGRILTVALAGGIAAEYLIHSTVFHGSTAGLGVTLALAIPLLMLLSGRWMIGRWPGRGSAAALVAALVFAAMISLRASPTLTLLNTTAVICLAPLAAYLYRAGRVGTLGVVGYVRAVLGGMVAGLGQPVLFARHDTGDLVKRLRGRTTGSRPILRALIPAAVLVLVFGALLASADAVFSRAIHRILGFDIDAGTVIAAAFLALLGAWLIIGLIRHATGSTPIEEMPRGLGYLGTTETITMLAPLAILFLAFVLIQITYLFGGVDTIEATGGLTRAEYYRQGFFQLVVVAALVTALILVVDWAHRGADRPPERSVVAVSATLVVLTLVMVVSALVRLKLYVDAFGLTELRVYTTAFTIWVGIALTLLLGTVLRGRRRPFALGALISGIVLGVGLNLINPDALIANINIDRHVGGVHELDADYLTRHLSADAVPAIVGRLDEIDDPCLRLDLAAGLGRHGEGAGGWRSLHWGFRRAEQALKGLPDLETGCDRSG